MAATPISLPDEIIIDILLKLSVKPLLKFKCTSKYWCTKISSPQFVTFHLNRSKQNKPRILSTHRSPQFAITLSSSEYENENPPERYKFSLHHTFLVVGTCNGLVCLSDYKTCVAICNPATNEYKEVKFGLPTDGKDRVFFLGFGYDAVTDKYKAVRIDITNSVDWEVYVYTVGSSLEWRKINTPVQRICRGSNTVHVNGALHWFNLSKNCKWRDYVHSVDCIVCFDIRKEKFGTLPPILFTKEESHHLGVMQECLSTNVFYRENGVGEHLDVWLMKEYGVKESWSKVYSIYVPVELSEMIESPVVVRRNGEILLKMDGDLYITKKNLYVYDPKKDNVGVFKSWIVDWVDVETYVESLVSIASLGEEETEVKQPKKGRKRKAL